MICVAEFEIGNGVATIEFIQLGDDRYTELNQMTYRMATKAVQSMARRHIEEL